MFIKKSQIPGPHSKLTDSECLEAEPRNPHFLKKASQVTLKFDFSNTIKNQWRDFPGGPAVKNPLYNAWDVSSTPGRGTKIPHVAGQLSPCTTTELACLNQSLCAANYRDHAPWTLCITTREEKTRTPQLERSLRTTTKSPRAATKTRRRQK